MPTTLDKPQVARALQKLHAAAATEDGAAKQRVLARETELGRRLDQAERYEIYGDAPLAIQPQVGRLLYVLAVSRRARAVVEFGASRGVSTLYLAAALKDAGGGSLVTTELRADKARATREALVDAGLDDLVELRVGDALETLRDLERDIDLLFLDGRNDLYLQVLRLVEPRLVGGALVVGDLNVDDPDLLPYLGHVREPGGDYLSVEVPLDAGVELSLRGPR